MTTGTWSSPIRHDLDPSDTDGLLVFALVENLARADLDPFDEADAYNRLLSRGWTHTEIARTVGKSTATVSTRLKLLQLTAGERRLVREGVITLAEAYDMVKGEHKARPRRMEANAQRRMHRLAANLRSNVAWLTGDDFAHDNPLLVTEAVDAINTAITYIDLLAAEVEPDPDIPPGQMRGRMTCHRCGHPIAAHPNTGVCP
jgi:hypothetical protein